jgi:hypothetical protein
MSTPYEWARPDLESAPFQYRVGSSFVEEFAQGHTTGDVLRELVQNEYDAQGRALWVSFGETGIEVTGRGRVIDPAGWRRLSVMLGTGQIAGDDRDVPQKTNAIGSKNFGLRSLFIFGDQIYVRSGGRQTLLDLHRGAWDEPLPDRASADRPGVHIFVPWRETANGRLEPYGLDREARDIEALADALAPTLMKLASPRGRRSLHAVTVSSTRLGRTLTWEQRVKLLGRHRAGGPTLERVIARAASEAERQERIVEREYQRSVRIPPALRLRDFPSYFRVPGGRVRIGISLRIRRRRPVLNDPGHFYYPLGAMNALTGCAISVSAPFEMNTDRRTLVDAGNSAWNAWLLEASADFVMDLVTEEWLDSFGAAAYLALPRHPQADHFSALLTERLKTGTCWPTRRRAAGSRRPQLEDAKRLMVGSAPELDALTGDERRLDERLDHPAVIEMVRDAGAKPFTVSSAVRLRCAGKDAGQLSTKVAPGEAELHYTRFPDALRSAALQEAFAKAFDRQRLSDDHRTDLSNSPTTLTAAGTLAAPSEPLWLLDPALGAASPVRREQQLHPALAAHRSIARLCSPFDTSAWVREVAERASKGDSSDEERSAVYAQLLRAPEAIRRPTWTVVKSSPVVRDARGDWAAPRDLVRGREARQLQEALRFPSDALLRSPALLSKLSIRSKLIGADLIAYAAVVAADPTLAEKFETFLLRRLALLTRPTIKRLRSIAFLRSTRGGLVPPEQALVRSPHLLRCVGPNADFVAGRHVSLYERLGCATEPKADDIVRYLDELRENSTAPPHPEVLYPALVSALRAEGSGGSLAEDPMLFDRGEWHAPIDVLLGRKHRPIFEGVLPIVSAGALERAYLALGANAVPRDRHWSRFFEWADGQSDSGERRLSMPARAALRKAYSRLGALPEDIAQRSRVLLDTEGRLHSKADARARRLLIDDDPTTARIVRERGLPIGFADLGDPSTRRLYQLAGTSLLTAARKPLGFTIGNDRAGPPGFEESTTLTRLRWTPFASAVYAVAAGSSRTLVAWRTFRQRLRAVTRVSFVTSLEERYTIGRWDLQVESDVAVVDGRIVLRFVRSKSEVNGFLARAVASMVENAPAAQRPLADAIFRILNCGSSAEIQRYLEDRGVPWSPEPGGTFDELLAEDELSDEAEAVAQVTEALKGRLLQDTRTPKPPSDAGAGDEPRSEEPEPPAPSLPPLNEVALGEVDPIAWTPGERGSGGGGGGGGWRPRTAAEQERDRALGRRGEELVLRDELKRVRALGLPEDRVVWTADTNPAANHDIRSVAEDGTDVWLEVKSTTGRHGRFDWPLPEFELALIKREKYVLCRVYEADTMTPVLLREADPVAKLLAGKMRLDISSLAAEVAPLR